MKISASYAFGLHGPCLHLGKQAVCTMRACLLFYFYYPSGVYPAVSGRGERGGSSLIIKITNSEDELFSKIV